MKEKPYKNRVFIKVFTSLIFLLSIILKAMSTESLHALLLCYHKGRQGFFAEFINRPSSLRQGRSEKKRPGNAGPFLRFFK